MRQHLFTVAVLSCLAVLTPGCEKEQILVPESYANDAFWVRIDNADLYATARGNQDNKVVIINIHGGPQTGAQYYALSRPLAYEALESAAVVVYYDQRGIGLSTGNFSTASITLKQYVKDLDVVIQTARHRYGADTDVFLLARSWGGLLAAEFLQSHDRQQHIAGWIEVNGAHDIIGVKRLGKVRLLEEAETQIALGNDPQAWQEIQAFATSFNPSTTSFDDLTELWRHGYEGIELLKEAGIVRENTTTSGLTEEQIAGNTAYSLLEVASNDLQGISDLMFDQLMEYKADLGQIEIPTLLIWGHYDLVVPYTVAEHAVQEIGTPPEDTYLRIYSDQAHFSMGDWESFASDALAFIEAYSSGQ